MASLLPWLGFHAAVLAAVWFWRRSAADRRALAESRRELEDLHRARESQWVEEQTKQQAVFNSMIEGLLILDEGGRVQFANPTLGQMFQLPRDVRGLTLLETLRLHELQELAVRAVAEGRVTGFELQLPGDNGRVLQINAASVRDPERAHAGTILVFHDLTRIKRLESVRKEFVANVSHELRTPLSMIKGYVETLLDGAKDDPAVATRFLQTIEKHADRLSFLIDDLLTISQLESGSVALNLQPLDLRDQVAAVARDLETRAKEREVRLVNEVPEDLAVRADGDRLQQVLYNLADNAIKYGRSGGEVRMGGRRMPGGRVEGWVADEGPGIPADSIERVFERFYRVDRARSREQGGTGLGLSIVKHIIQGHGGEVRAESTPGKGATFYYTLQAAE
ncbi:MAG: PAS domain-containing protein [Verrucomicrobiae bacterium]|nr:PAS domain-containing protein [Verrucomicrobiae bacterium]